MIELASATAYPEEDDAPPSSQAILAATLAHIDRGVIVTDAAGGIVSCNDQAVRMLGLTHAPEIGEPYLSPHAGTEEPLVARANPRSDVVLKMENGTILDGALIRLPQGGVLRIYRDVTDQRRQAEALRLATTDYRSLFQNAVVGIYRSSIDGTEVRANPTLARLNGFETEAELRAAIARDGNNWYVDPNRRAEFQRLMAESGSVTDFVSEIVTTGSRKRIWISETAWLVRDEHGEPAFYEGTVVEASERLEAEARNAHLALHDEMTGLPNRTSFKAQLARDVAQATRDQSIALFCLDIDHFKEVNDTLGHDAGDRLLREIGMRLRSVVRSSDLVARLGGDEFAIVLRGLSAQADVQRVAEAVLDAVRAPLTLAERAFQPSVSIGIALCPHDAASDDELYRCADAALYEAKAKGRNGWSFFDPALRERSVRRREIGGSLAAAIAGEALHVTFEPQVAIESGGHAGFEARIEWRSKGIDVPPQELIRVAEETGQMIALGDHVLAVSLRRLGDLVAAGQEPGHLAVNVGATQLKDAQFPDRVAAMMAAFGLSHARLELELTEDVMLDRSNGMIRDTLERLHRMSISIAIDDFGSGYASVTQLKRFPVDKVKIGRSFVRRLGTGSEGADIPTTILNLAQGLGLDVVAEGVESQDQFDMLSAHRCDYAQGELISRPLDGVGAIVDYLVAREVMRRNADAFFI
ncbi:MAG TPA: bifunctional diguanylate cyclase/phosphodiesterase [Saliniramus sp.]|nr:bifunctional diguanylate cyclase/phosphodiesterase [Saliniramus sp.]